MSTPSRRTERSRPVAGATGRRTRPRPAENHRDIQGGAARAAVFGVSDGLLTNVSLILGVAAANPAPGFVRLAGLAGLLAGAFSMGAGEYISMRAQGELIDHEVETERDALEREPDAERDEMVAVYVRRGVDEATSRKVVETLHRNPAVALEVHTREELGVGPEGIGSPPKAAISSLVSFACGAILPLLPWFFFSGTGAVVTSVVIGGAAALVIGAAVAHFAGRPLRWGAARQLLITSAVAAVTFGIGHVVGVGSAG